MKLKWLIELLTETLPEPPKLEYRSIDEGVVEILTNGEPVCQIAVFSAEAVNEFKRWNEEQARKLEEEERNKPWYKKIYESFQKYL